MPCFVERILPEQEGEVRHNTEGGLLPGLLPGKTLSLFLSHTQHSLTDTGGKDTLRYTGWYWWLSV